MHLESMIKENKGTYIYQLCDIISCKRFWISISISLFFGRLDFIMVSLKNFKLKYRMMTANRGLYLVTF